MCTTGPAHLIHLYLIIQLLCNEEQKLRSCALCSWQHSSLICSFAGPNIFLNTAFLSLCWWAQRSVRKKRLTAANFFQKMVLIRGTWCSELCRSVIGSAELGALNESRAKNVLCDAVLRTADGGAFPVHRTVLLMHSDFFRFVWLLMWFNNVWS
jgi:hypothetical protein